MKEIGLNLLLLNNSSGVKNFPDCGLMASWLSLAFANEIQLSLAGLASDFSFGHCEC